MSLISSEALRHNWQYPVTKYVFKVQEKVILLHVTGAMHVTRRHMITPFQKRISCSIYSCQGIDILMDIMFSSIEAYAVWWATGVAELTSVNEKSHWRPNLHKLHLISPCGKVEIVVVEWSKVRFQFHSRKTAMHHLSTIHCFRIKHISMPFCSCIPSLHHHFPLKSFNLQNNENFMRLSD